VLPGEISPCTRTGDAGGWRREKSAEAIVATWALLRGEGPHSKESASTVSLGRARRQMTNAQFELPLGAPGEARGRERSGEACPAGPGSEHSGGAVPEELMGAVVARSNLVRAGFAAPLAAPGFTRSAERE